MRFLKGFIKDQLLDFAGYVSITILILFFFYLQFGNRVQIIYPIIMMLFVLTVITLLKGIHFYRFFTALQSNNFIDFEQNSATYQEKQIITFINVLQKHYYQELSLLTSQRDESYTFIAQMAHDLKIPVSVINLILDDITDKPFTLENKNLLKVESNKINDKLTHLLSFLRLGQFEKDYTIERLNLIDEIRAAINRKKDYFILNAIYPRFDSGQTPIYILTDQKWHSMMLDQLISNAIKFSALKGEGGYINFDVNLVSDSATLTITDYGIGIPEYDLGRVFEPFFTGENGRKSQGSSGIGLYLCKSIADKLGHKITIHSIKNEITEVSIRYLTKL